MKDEKQERRKIDVVENMQYITLALTVVGQITVGSIFLLGQGCWLVANIIAVARDFILKRPTADKVKDAAMLGITVGLVIAGLLGVY